MPAVPAPPTPWSLLRVLVTGAAGSVGGAVRAGLAGRYAELRLLDREPLLPTSPGETVVRCDISDRDAVRDAARGVDCIVHLAGVPTEASWKRCCPPT